ncbi:hypothetical protein SDRG_11792 [Saprolegnia diclina VS20]|uniref:Uncharacterized protein n=1 Tax=Saprolegnia diclina (strain VS20) TaxID=1156394 RepID=T0QAG4_SAPDV|nr:hypothetical protein SDRG_11792 [Saprolegnia diclina VS20]EQC30475.1 hypothetical protein SDRG_11792 [Saprolegnia diclina VS20]|eukprot:XP_008616068.1 hypothetical protein SDRG_11792 [Saprolegnia diclina VS20]
MQLVLALSALLVSAAQAATYPTYTIPAVDMAAPAAAAETIDALQTTGIVAFKNIDGFEAARLAYVEAAARCVATPHADVMRKLMVDGTMRRTLSTNVDVSTVPSSLLASCPEYVSALGSFNAVLNTATLTFAKLLDATTQTSLVQDIVEQGKHLEHFHAYTNPASDDVADETQEFSLEAHTDLGGGLFTSAPVFFNAQHQVIANPDPTTGLYIQIKNEWVQPVLKSDELVFMAGEGWSQWIATDDLAFPAVVHAMRMPRDASSDIVRGFHGRMLLLSDEMVMRNNHLRFDAFNARNTRYLKAPLADAKFPTLACASRRLVASDSSCTLGIWAPGNASAASTTTDICMFHCNAIGMPEDTQKCKDLGCVKASDIPNGGTDCWMICVQKYSDAECPAPKAQTCKDQELTCDKVVLTKAPKTNATTTTTAPTIVTTAPKATSSATSALVSMAVVVLAVAAN